MEAEALETVDAGLESVESTESTQSTETQETEDPYSSKASRAYSEFLKNQRELLKDNPEASKFLRLSKDNHARLYQLQQMEPRGIDGIREKYAMLDSVVHGELKGVEAIGALQDELRGVQEIDERLFSGDVTALKEMGDEFVQQALPKLAGPILEMVRDSNPEAYLTTVLPHVVEALKETPIISSFNGLVDILNEAPPKWLTENQKTLWTEDRIQRITAMAAKLSNSFNAMEAKVGQLPKPIGVTPTKQSGKPDELETLRKEQETQHWNTNIQPTLDKHAESTFSKLFAPYAKRLRLDAAATADLKSAWIGRAPRNGDKGSGVIGKAWQSKSYADQINRYHSQRRPDANTVSNFARVEFDKHAENELKALVNQRYKPFLNGGQKTAPALPNGAKKGPIGANVQVVSVKPANIDYKNTPLDWMHQKKYRTLDGKIVQLQR